MLSISVLSIAAVKSCLLSVRSKEDQAVSQTIEISILFYSILAPGFHRIGPSIAMVLFQSRRVIGHWATISTVTGWD